VIAVAGEALIDAHVDGALLHTFPGGGPFNTAVALARLGVPAAFLGAVSRDPFGRRLEETLRSAGVEARSLHASQRSTLERSPWRPILRVRRSRTSLSARQEGGRSSSTRTSGPP
jgi:sugar/nucleoside kinase (ribokinase family)